jgi:serine/threonine-protein phosphatase 2A activator
LLEDYIFFIMALDGSSPVRILEILDLSHGHAFITPVKKIHEGHDVPAFLTSRAYSDIMTFLLQLNRAMFPRKVAGTVQSWPLNSDAVEFSEPVRRLQDLLSRLEAIMEEAPPDKGPRRFGNISFRKWYRIVESRVSNLLDECLSSDLLSVANPVESESPTAKTELTAYFLGSFGSPQRLDNGTGHELSFLAFLACLWKLNGFPKADPGVEERGIVLGVIQPWVPPEYRPLPS